MAIPTNLINMMVLNQSLIDFLNHLYPGKYFFCNPTHPLYSLFPAEKYHSFLKNIFTQLLRENNYSSTPEMRFYLRKELEETVNLFIQLRIKSVIDKRVELQFLFHDAQIVKQAIDDPNVTLILNNYILFDPNNIIPNMISAFIRKMAIPREYMTTQAEEIVDLYQQF